MSKSPTATKPAGEGEMITILLVDDIPETRENIKKMLAFEPDLKVVGTAGTGREGLALAKELKPNIIIMDINMPDMDGIQATTLITEAVPTTAVIMMSVQTDQDYLRRAMLAGARNFLGKPIGMEELYNTIRTVHARNKPIAATYAAAAQGIIDRPAGVTGVVDGENRAGHIIVVYSPQGGVGVTTISTSLASGLMKEGVRVLLVDADLQFGDIGAVLNLKSPSTLVELIPDVDDLDVELFENIVTTHNSGLKVLLGPSKPEFAEEVVARPDALAQILQKISGNYDFIVVDTSTHLDEVLLSLFDIASRIVLVGTPSIPCAKNIKMVLDLFDKLSYPPDKVALVLNRLSEDRNVKKIALTPEQIEHYLKRQIVGRIPLDELFMLTAVKKAVPVVAAERDKSRSPIRELMDVANLLYTALMGSQEQEMPDLDDKKKKSGLSLRLGNR
jgi:pilus assembly protein CpaE